MKTKECFICKLAIDIKKENHIKISEYVKGKHFKDIFCHSNCWREHMSNKAMMRQTLGVAVEASKKLQEVIN